jgi:hypothetical protein
MEHAPAPKIGDYIINPSSGRTVKVGSKVWIKLVRANIVSGECVDEHVIDDIEDNCSQGELDEKLTQIKSQLPSGITATRGRGKYANKIVKRHKQLNIQEITKKTAKLASKIVNQDDRSDELDEDELEQMIFNELMIGKRKIVKQTPTRKANTANYQTKEITDCSQSESEEDEYNI